LGELTVLPQTLYLVYRDPTSKGEGREGREKERRVEEGGRPPLRKFLDPPLTTA